MRLLIVPETLSTCIVAALSLMLVMKAREALISLRWLWLHRRIPDWESSSKSMRLGSMVESPWTP